MGGCGCVGGRVGGYEGEGWGWEGRGRGLMVYILSGMDIIDEYLLYQCRAVQLVHTTQSNLLNQKKQRKSRWQLERFALTVIVYCYDYETALKCNLTCNYETCANIVYNNCQVPFYQLAGREAHGQLVLRLLCVFRIGICICASPRITCTIITSCTLLPCDLI